MSKRSEQYVVKSIRLEQVEQLAHWLAWKTTSDFDDQQELAQEAMLYAWQFLDQRPDASRQLLGCVMWRHILRFRFRIQLQHQRMESLPPVLADESPHAGEQQCLLDDFLYEVGKRCGSTARSVAQALIVRRESNCEVRKAMQISPQEFGILLTDIRRVAETWLAA